VANEFERKKVLASAVYDKITSYPFAPLNVAAVCPAVFRLFGLAMPEVGLVTCTVEVWIGVPDALPSIHRD